MNSVLMLAGRAAGILGILICALAVVGRLSGQFWLGGFQLGTLLLAGTAAIAAGCFLLLLELGARR